MARIAPAKRISLPARLQRDALRGDEPPVSHKAEHCLLTLRTDRIAATIAHGREQTISYLLSVLKALKQ